MMALADVIAFLEDSTLADSIREGDTLFPVIESVHVLAISLVIGSILVLDLRLLGIASLDRPVSRLSRSILPVTWCAFATAAASGSLLFIANLTKYLGNGWFVAKMSLLALAGLNMIVFHAVTARDLPRWERNHVPPRSARLAGLVSIVVWIAIVTCGRMIGFTLQEL